MYITEIDRNLEIIDDNIDFEFNENIEVPEERKKVTNYI